MTSIDLQVIPEIYVIETGKVDYLCQNISKFSKIKVKLKILTFYSICYTATQENSISHAETR